MFSKMLFPAGDVETYCRPPATTRPANTRVTACRASRRWPRAMLGSCGTDQSISGHPLTTLVISRSLTMVFSTAASGPFNDSA